TLSTLFRPMITHDMVRRLALLALAACGSAVPPSATPAPADPRAAELLARYAAWRGPVDRLGVVALAGEASIRGVPAPVALVAAPAGAYEETVDLGGATTTHVAGPDGAFTVNVSGAVEHTPDAERAIVADRLARLLGRGLRAEAARYLGERPRDGRTWSVVRI